MELKKLNDRISYFESVKEPLSSDVFIIKGNKNTYIFDAGNNSLITKYLNSIKGKKTLILSHFHKDHTGMAKETEFNTLYGGSYTCKSLNEGTRIAKALDIADGDLTLKIIPIPSSHAKGCLALLINNDILLTGDALYPGVKSGRDFYNKSILYEEIKILSSIDFNYCILSHDNGKLRKKAFALKLLEKEVTRSDS